MKESAHNALALHALHLPEHQYSRQMATEAFDFGI